MKFIGVDLSLSLTNAGVVFPPGEVGWQTAVRLRPPEKRHKSLDAPPRTLNIIS